MSSNAAKTNDSIQDAPGGLVAYLIGRARQNHTLSAIRNVLGISQQEITRLSEGRSDLSMMRLPRLSALAQADHDAVLAFVESRENGRGYMVNMVGETLNHPGLGDVKIAAVRSGKVDVVLPGVDGKMVTGIPELTFAIEKFITLPPPEKLSEKDVIRLELDARMPFGKPKSPVSDRQLVDVIPVERPVDAAHDVNTVPQGADAKAVAEAVPETSAVALIAAENSLEPELAQAAIRHSGLSRKKLADAMGVSDTAVGEWKSGRRRVIASRVSAFLKACNVADLDELKKIAAEQIGNPVEQVSDGAAPVVRDEVTTPTDKLAPPRTPKPPMTRVKRAATFDDIKGDPMPRDVVHYLMGKSGKKNRQIAKDMGISLSMLGFFRQGRYAMQAKYIPAFLKSVGSDEAEYLHLRKAGVPEQATPTEKHAPAAAPVDEPSFAAAILSVEEAAKPVEIPVVQKVEAAVELTAEPETEAEPAAAPEVVLVPQVKAIEGPIDAEPEPVDQREKLTPFTIVPGHVIATIVEESQSSKADIARGLGISTATLKRSSCPSGKFPFYRFSTLMAASGLSIERAETLLREIFSDCDEAINRLKEGRRAAQAPEAAVAEVDEATINDGVDVDGDADTVEPEAREVMTSQEPMAADAVVADSDAPQQKSGAYDEVMEDLYAAADETGEQGFVAGMGQADIPDPHGTLPEMPEQLIEEPLAEVAPEAEPSEAREADTALFLKVLEEREKVHSADLAALNSQIEQLNGKVGGLEGVISRLEGKIDALTAARPKGLFETLKDTFRP